MRIEYAKDISKQKFYESGENLVKLGLLKPSAVKPGQEFLLGEIENPSAAWDKTKISALSMGDIISFLFNPKKIPVTSEYDGVKNEWYGLSGTWPCTIDTLVHLVGQRESESIPKAEKILDLCCGTGMVGVYALNKGNPIQLDFADIEPNALRSVVGNFLKYSYDLNSVDKKIKKVSQIVTDGFSNIKGKYDLILVSAPPAIPIYPLLDRPVNLLFDGTELLERILRDAPEHLNKEGKMILSHTGLGNKAFDEASKKYGAKVDRILSQRENAFRTEFLGSQEWVDYLVKEHGLISKPQNSSYNYGHIVTTKEISYN
ncbi:methyltransferase [Candidatus Woesearchaeota archaeon]|nr:methyltransferase [Candidatus Woesearchaeota archaeon]